MNPVHPTIEEFEDNSVDDGELLERRNRGGALGDTAAWPNGITPHSAPPTPPDLSSRRSSDQDTIVNRRVIVSSGGNAGEPVSPLRDPRTAILPLVVPSAQNNNNGRLPGRATTEPPPSPTAPVETVPKTVLSDDVSALQSVGSSYWEDAIPSRRTTRRTDNNNTRHPVSNEILVDDDDDVPPPPPPPSRFLNNRRDKSASQPTTAATRTASSSSSSIVDYDVPPPLLPSPPIRGAGRVPSAEQEPPGRPTTAKTGASSSTVNSSDGDNSTTAAARPTVLQSTPSHDDTITTSASMKIRESGRFVREVDVDLDACIDEILYHAATSRRSNGGEASPRSHQDQKTTGEDPSTGAGRARKGTDAATSFDSPLDPDKIKKTLTGRSNHSGAEGNCSVLTDEELPAIITPTLRRQGTTSTPGAFRAGGANGNNPTEPLPPPSPLAFSSTHSTVHSTMTRQASTNVSRRLVRSFSYDSVDDSCRTPVTATLVTERDESQTNDEVTAVIRARRDQPLVVAHAEPLEKSAIQRKRRCILAWLFLVAVMGSATLGIITAWSIAKKPSQDKLPEVGSDNATNVQPILDKNMTDPRHHDIGMQWSSHAVMWGLVSTCRDDHFFTNVNNALKLQCGGELRILEATNADCYMQKLDGEGNITDTSSAFCVLRKEAATKVLLAGGRYYGAIKAWVNFDCYGTTLLEHAATANLPPMEVNGCSNEPISSNEQEPADRRNLRSAVPVATFRAPSLAQARSRALQTVVVGGGAASYLSMGRFCSENGDWVLWHEWYECEMGERFFVSNLGVIRGALPKADELFSGGGLTALLSFLGLNSNDGGDDRRIRQRARLQSVDEIPYAQIAEVLDAQNFCFSKESCNVTAFNCTVGQSCAGCNVSTEELIMSNYDPRPSCRWKQGGPDLAERKRTVVDELEPERLVDVLATEI